MKCTKTSREQSQPSPQPQRSVFLGELPPSSCLPSQHRGAMCSVRHPICFDSNSSNYPHVPPDLASSLLIIHLQVHCTWTHREPFHFEMPVQYSKGMEDAWLYLLKTLLGVVLCPPPRRTGSLELCVHGQCHKQHCEKRRCTPAPCMCVN